MKAYRLLYPGFFLYFLFLIVGGFLLFIFPKGDILYSINNRNSPLGDFLFKYGTYLGDGLIFAILMLIFVLFDYYKTLIIGLTVILQTFLVQTLKRIVFNDQLRPKAFLENFSELHIIPGIDIVEKYAFPSGHSATAFAVAVLLSLFIKNRSWSLLFILTAIFAAVSRVYLLQHFFIDIYFGSMIGFLSAYLVYAFMDKTSLQENQSWRRGLIFKNAQ